MGSRIGFRRSFRRPSCGRLWVLSAFGSAAGDQSESDKLAYVCLRHHSSRRARACGRCIMARAGLTDCLRGRERDGGWYLLVTQDVALPERPNRHLFFRRRRNDNHRVYRVLGHRSARRPVPNANGGRRSDASHSIERCGDYVIHADRRFDVARSGSRVLGALDHLDGCVCDAHVRDIHTARDRGESHSLPLSLVECFDSRLSCHSFIEPSRHNNGAATKHRPFSSADITRCFQFAS